jgi:hypothetical protein
VVVDGTSNGLSGQGIQSSNSSSSERSFTSKQNSMNVDDTDSDSFDASDWSEFIPNGKRMEEIEICEVDVSFVSNGTTLIGQSPARESVRKR